jgi:hypothetical protein
MTLMISFLAQARRDLSMIHCRAIAFNATWQASTSGERAWPMCGVRAAGLHDFQPLNSAARKSMKARTFAGKWRRLR